MDIVTVVGTVVCTRKEEKLRGYKLLLVSKPDDPAGDILVALDTVGAGVGERVIVVRGSSARAAADLEGTPVDAAIIGIIDHIEQEGETVFQKGTGEPHSS
jgi:microcompartment protein CcmK/EutM